MLFGPCKDYIFHPVIKSPHSKDYIFHPVIKSPHSLFRDFCVGQAASSSLSPSSRLQQLWAQANLLAITPEGYKARQSKLMNAKSMAELLGHCPVTTWAGQTGELANTGPFQLCGSRCGPRPPMKLARSCCLPKQRLLLRSNLRSFVGLWVKTLHRNKTACSKSNTVQSSRSESTTCLKKGRLLRFELNSTATWQAKLWNDVWHDSESIAPKNWSQIGSKWNVIFESRVETSIDSTSFGFRFEVFLSNLPS